MDGVYKRATNQARDVDLVEVRSVGQSELLSACEVLGGRTLRISREKECDLLTSEGCARAAELLSDTVRQLAGSQFPLVSGARGPGWTVMAHTGRLRSSTKDDGWFGRH